MNFLIFNINILINILNIYPGLKNIKKFSSFLSFSPSSQVGKLGIKSLPQIKKN
jgi:hypothetical protein